MEFVKNFTPPDFQVKNGEIYTAGNKFYTAAGSDGIDKFHLWSNTNENTIYVLFCSIYKQIFITAFSLLSYMVQKVLHNFFSLFFYQI